MYMKNNKSTNAWVNCQLHRVGPIIEKVVYTTIT